MNEEKFVLVSTDEFEQLLDLLNGYEILCSILTNANSELHDTIIELKEELKLEQDFASRWQKESEMLANEGMQLLEDKEKLEKENKQLQAELDSFRPVLFHDMRIGTITLYSKGGIDE